MSLITGTPAGTITSPEDIYLEGAPYIYFQRWEATPLFNPDSNGFYWGLSATASYPVYNVGCPSNVSFTDNITMNDVLCENVGVKDTLMQRNYIEYSFDLKGLFPFSYLTHILKYGTVTEDGAAHTETFGFGKVNNNVYWHVYCPKVYDEDVGDYVMFYFHKCKFVGSPTMNMPFADAWNVAGVTVRAFADTTYSTAQMFGVGLRSDLSVL